jgi:hypothetical protein
VCPLGYPVRVSPVPSVVCPVSLSVIAQVLSDPKATQSRIHFRLSFARAVCLSVRLSRPACLSFARYIWPSSVGVEHYSVRKTVFSYWFFTVEGFLVARLLGLVERVVCA